MTDKKTDETPEQKIAKLGRLLKQHYSCWHYIGEIVKQETRSETHISGSGGGGNVSTGTNIAGKRSVSGSVSPVKISSTVVTVQEFWIKQDDGTEKKVTLRNWDKCEAREGHRIAVMYMGEEGESERVVYVCNLTTNTEVEHINIGDEEVFSSVGDPTHSVGCSAFGYGLLTFVAIYLFNKYLFTIPFWPGVALIAVIAIVMAFRAKSHNTAVTKQLGESLGEAYRSGRASLQQEIG